MAALFWLLSPVTHPGAAAVLAGDLGSKVGVEVEGHVE